MKSFQRLHLLRASLLLVVSLWTPLASAAVTSFTFEGYLENELVGGSGNFIPDNGTHDFAVSIIGEYPAGTYCTLYSESHLAVATANGVFSFPVGEGTSPSISVGETITSLFQNRASIPGSACTFNATQASARRWVQITLDPSSTNLNMGNVAISKVPNAIFSDVAAVANNLSVTGTSGQILSTGSNGGLTWINAPVSNPGTVTSVTAGTGLTGGPITSSGSLSLANTAVTPGTYGSATQVAQIIVDAQGRLTAANNISISAATTAALGEVQFATLGGTAALTAVQASDPRLSDARPPMGAAAGDLSGAYPNPQVASLQGTPLSATAPSNSQFLRYSAAGSAWAPAYANFSDLKTSMGVAQIPTTCTASQTLTYSAVTDTFSCTNISIANTAVSGLGGAALLNVGTLAGTVATGNDPRIVGAIQNAGGTVSFQSGLDASRSAAGNMGAIYLATDTQKIYRDNGTSWVLIASNNISSGTITSVTAGTGLVGGGVSGAVTLSMSNASTSNSFSGPLVGDVTGTQSATIVSAVGGSNAANIHSAELAANGATSSNLASAIVRRDVSGGFSAGGISAGTVATTGGHIFRDLASNSATILAPATITTSYVLRLPVAVPSSGQVLSSDGSGNMSWVSTATGSVTSVTAGTGLSGGTFANVGTISLANTNVTAGSYGSATQVATFTVNGQGQLTNSGNVTITGVTPGGSAGGDLTGSYPSPSLAQTGVSSGSYGSATQVPILTVDGKGRITAATTATVTSVGFSGNLAGDITGIQGATVAVSVGGSSSSNIHSAELAANAATSINTSNTIVKRDAAGGFSAGAITVGTVSTTGGQIFKDLGSNSVLLQAPSSVTASYILRLPIQSPGAGQILSSDSSGNMTWLSGLVSGGIGLFGDGTAANPAISFLSNSGTGFFKAANNTLGLSTGGAERLRIDATGNLGVGTTSPMYKLDVAGISNSSTGFGIAGSLVLASSGTSSGSSGNLFVGNGVPVKGSQQVAVGTNTLLSSGGTSNVAVGAYALKAETGSYNTVVGDSGLLNATSASYNTALGMNTGHGISTASNNTLLGFSAGYMLSSGSNNTIVGYGVGSGTASTGSNNILIGTSSSVDTPNATTSNYLNIGGTITGDLSGKNVGIGTTMPNAKLEVAGALRLDGGTSGFVGFQAPAVAAGNLIWTLPAADGGSGQVLATSGAGILTWASMTSSQWITGGTSISYSSGNVGIGTTSPSIPFHVYSASSAQALFQSAGANSSQVRIDNLSGGYQSSLAMQDAGITKWVLGKQTDNSFYMYDSVYARDFVEARNGNLLFQPAGGSVGVGTSSPYYNLDVWGSGRFTGLVQGNQDISASNNLIAGNSVVGFPSPGSNLTIDSTTNATKGSISIAPNGGFVGIGTFSPTAMLDLYKTSSPALKIRDGSQAPGNILTSDASGNSSWAPPSFPAKIRFTRSMVSASYSGVDRNALCISDFGPRYQGASELDLLANWSGPSGGGSTGTNYFLVSDGAVASGNMVKANFSTSAGLSFSSVTASGAVPVACVYKFLPIRFTTLYYAYNSPPSLTTKDNECQAEFGPTYQNASLFDLTALWAGFGSGISTINSFFVSDATTPLYSATYNSTYGTTFSTYVGTSVSWPVACVAR